MDQDNIKHYDVSPEDFEQEYQFSNYEDIDLGDININKDQIDNPEPLTFGESISLDIQKSYWEDHAKGNIPTTTIGVNQSQRYNDPLIPLKAGYDYEELYAKYKPTTLGRAVSSAYNIAFHDVTFGLRDTVSRIKNWSSGEGFNNEDGIEDYVNSFLSAQNQVPLYHSKNDSEVGKFIYDAIAASGSVVGSLIEGIISSAVITVLTEGAGAPIAALKLGNNIRKIGTKLPQTYNAIRKASETATGLKVATALNKAPGMSKTLFTGYLTATGESHLQAELNKRAFIERNINKYLKDNGEAPVGEELIKIQESANKLYNSTYSQNIGLVMWSTYKQIPSILSGKLVNKSIGKKLVNELDDTGKLITKSTNTKRKKLWELTKDAATEGFEEFTQSVIDESTTEYYNALLDGEIDEKFLGGFAYSGNSLSKAIDKGAIREGAIGALLGGSVHVLTQGTKSFLSDDTKSDVLLKEFQEETNNLKELGKHFQLINRSSKALAKEDVDEEGEFNNILANIAMAAYKTETTDNRRDFIEKMKSISIEEFNKITDFKVTEEDRITEVDDMLRVFDLATSFRANMDRIHPNNKIFKDRLLKKIAPRFANLDEKEQKIQNRYNEVKDIATLDYVKAHRVNNEIKRVRTNLQADFGDNLFSNFFLQKNDFNTNLKGYEKQLEEDISNALPNDIDDLKLTASKKLLKELKASKNSKEKMDTLFKSYRINNKENRQNLKDYYNLTKLLKEYINAYQEIQTESGMLSKIKTIIETTEELKQDIDDSKVPNKEKKVDEPIEKKEQKTPREEDEVVTSNPTQSSASKADQQVVSENKADSAIENDSKFDDAEFEKQLEKLEKEPPPSKSKDFEPTQDFESFKEKLTKKKKENINKNQRSSNMDVYLNKIKDNTLRDQIRKTINKLNLEVEC